MFLTKIVKSSNLTIQSLMLLLYSFLSLVDFPIPVAEEIVTFIKATLLAGTGFWGVIRDFISKGIKFKYSANVLNYILLFVGGAVTWMGPYIAELGGAISELIRVITAGNTNLIFPALFSVGTIIFYIVRDKPWQADPALKN
jgi:hypothetical protein